MLAYVGKFTYLSAAKTQIKNIRHLAKVNIKYEKTTPFGGIYYAWDNHLKLFTTNIIGNTKQ